MIANPPIVNRVLVPVTNPATADNLLRLGLTLTFPQTGHLIAAYVSTQHGTARPGAYEKIAALVRTLNEEGANISLVSHTGPTIARGILDLATAHSTDLVVLGVRAHPNGRMALGPVVEEVARTAPQHVVIFRSAAGHPLRKAFDQVLVPVDGQPPSELATHIGLRMTPDSGTLWLSGYGAESETSQQHYATAVEILEEAQKHQKSPASFRKEVVDSNNMVEGILERADADTLVVMGVSEKEWSVDNWLAWDIPQRLLNEAPGAVMLVKQSAREEASLSKRLQYWLHDLLPTLTPREQQQVVQEGGELARSTSTFFTLVILSSLIASLGLLQNSAAVIIGAMLIAPLMAPLMGFALGLTQGKPYVMRRATLTIFKAIALVLVITAVLGFIWPVKTPTEEMLARGTPSLLDLMVAVFSGMVGAYALARKEVSSTLAGVSIAAALMPPLCTVGMAYAAGETALASGAFLLFLTNIVSISLAAAGVFVWMGVRLRLRDKDRPHQRTRLIVSLATLVILAIPLTVSMGRWVRTANRINTAWVTLREIYGTSSVMNIDMLEEPEMVSVIATVRVPRDIFGYELTSEHLELLTQGQDLLRERVGTDNVRLYVDAQPLFSVPGEPPAENFVTNGRLHGMLRRQECANQPDARQCVY